MNKKKKKKVKFWPFSVVTFPLLCYYPNMHAHSLYKQYDCSNVHVPIIFFIVPENKALFVLFVYYL